MVEIDSEPSGSDYVLEMKNVDRVYQKSGSRSVKALDNVNLKLAGGNLIIVKGPSGSGKTTILNIMGGLDQPTSGQVYLKGKNLKNYSERELTELRRGEIGFIFQTFGLIQSFTAFENVELPMRISHVSWKKRKERARRCLKIVGLGDRTEHRIFELSGGEQQRVGIARALTNEPSLILADEPTGEVDYETGVEIMNLFRELIEKRGITVCVATHDPAAMEFGDLSFEIIDGKLSQKE